jgi:hypothetical protein
VIFLKSSIGTCFFVLKNYCCKICFEGRVVVVVMSVVPEGGIQQHVGI